MHLSKLFTIAAGVLGAVVCYALVTRFAVNSGLVSETATLHVVKMVAANIGALVAAAAIAAWPSDRAAPLFESFMTWAMATVVLVTIAAPSTAPERTILASPAKAPVSQDIVRR